MPPSLACLLELFRGIVLLRCQRKSMKMRGRRRTTLCSASFPSSLWRWMAVLGLLLLVFDRSTVYSQPPPDILLLATLTNPKDNSNWVAGGGGITDAYTGDQWWLSQVTKNIYHYLLPPPPIISSRTPRYFPL